MKEEKRNPLMPRKRPGSKVPDVWVPDEESEEQEHPIVEDLEWMDGEMFRINLPPDRVLN